MSRPIKFQGEYRGKLYPVISINFDKNEVILQIGQTYCVVDLDKVDLYQFTGLLDKDGKEIFEGHRLKVGSWYIGDHYYNECFMAVTYKGGCFTLSESHSEAPSLCEEEIQNCGMKIIGHTAEEGKDGTK